MRRSLLVAVTGALLAAAACANLDGLAGGGGALSNEPEGGTERDSAAPASEAGDSDGVAPSNNSDAATSPPIPLDVAVNLFATCATVDYGSAAGGHVTYCWGAQKPTTPEYLGVSAIPGNGFAQPGLQTAEGAATPLVVSALYGSGAWFVAQASAVPGAPVRAYGWGGNDSLQAGSNVTPTAPPTALEVPDGTTLSASTVGAGPLHGCLVDGAGALYCWGGNSACEVTAGTSPAVCAAVAQVTSDTNILGGDGGVFERVASGAHTTCAVMHAHGSTTSSIVCWGADGALQAGRSPAVGYATPAALTFPGQAPAVGSVLLAGGNSHACAVIGGSLYCWGSNGQGQIDPSNALTTFPVTLVSPVPVTALDIAAAGTTTCLVGQRKTLDAKTRIFCYGAGELGHGEIGGGDNEAGPPIVPVDGIEDISKIAISPTHGCAIAHPIGDTSSSPGLYCWGTNTAAQVDPSALDARFDSPHLVPFPISPASK